MNTPYTTPETTSPPSMPNLIEGNLQHIAKMHRHVNYAFLGYLCVMIIPVAISTAVISESFVGAVIFGISYLTVCIFGAVSVFRLMKSMGGIGVATIGMLGMLIPIVGFIILLIINGIASKKLKGAGYKVGLLGAKLAN